jgi:putative photosynthetic complex assembly protein 2
VACFLERIWAVETQADIVGFALLSALSALALLEHWFMVLPLPDEKLWRWMLAERTVPNQAIKTSEDAR